MSHTRLLGTLRRFSRLTVVAAIGSAAAASVLAGVANIPAQPQQAQRSPADGAARDKTLDIVSVATSHGSADALLVPRERLIFQRDLLGRPA